MVPVPTAAIPARTAPRICVARPTAPTAFAPNRPTIIIDERPSTESSPNDIITGQASAHTSKRIRSMGGRVIATPPGTTSGAASRNSDMIVNSYASTSPDSQSCGCEKSASMSCLKPGGDDTGSFSYVRIVAGNRNASPQIMVAAAGANLRPHFRRGGDRLLISSRHRRARRERSVQRLVGGEAGNRRNRANPGAAGARKISVLLRHAALLLAHFRTERDFAALDVGSFLADKPGARVRARLRNVRRQHSAGGGRDLGIQSARRRVRTHGANVPDAHRHRAGASA